MSADLPDRLRALAEILGNGDQDLNIWGEQVAEAAAEIDRLRKLITTAYYTDDEERLELLGEELFYPPGGLGMRG